MPMPIHSVGSNASPLALQPAEAPTQSGFGAMLQKAANAVMQPQQEATRAVEQFARGADGELHDTMLSQERADISLKFMVSVRNRALEAYREIMRMGQ